MSNHAAHAHPRPGINWGWWGAYVGLPGLVVATLIAAPLMYHRWFLPDGSWPAYEGKVLETRIVNAGGLENPLGNSGFWRLEVRAVWTEHGVRMEAWVPTTKANRDSAWLSLWASRQADHCTVRVSPGNPGERLAFFP